MAGEGQDAGMAKEAAASTKTVDNTYWFDLEQGEKVTKKLFKS